MKRPFTDLLTEEAVRRGLRRPEQPPLLLSGAFELVRDMPYGRPSDTTVEAVIKDWKGTCSGKHELLYQVFKELGFNSTRIACTQEIRLPESPMIPEPVKQFFADGPVVDVHNYLILHTEHTDMIVDATWPKAVSFLGLPVNEEFEWGKSMCIACLPLESYSLDDAEDLYKRKEEILQAHFTPEQLRRREVFIQMLGQLFGQLKYMDLGEASG